MEMSEYLELLRGGKHRLKNDEAVIVRY